MSPEAHFERSEWHHRRMLWAQAVTSLDSGLEIGRWDQRGWGQRMEQWKCGRRLVERGVTGRRWPMGATQTHKYIPQCDSRSLDNTDEQRWALRARGPSRTWAST